MLIIVKLTLVPSIIALIAITGRYWGARVPGLLSGLPVIAGPISYFIFLDQGIVFAQSAAVATVTSVAALSSFCFIYAWLSTRAHWFTAVIFSLLAYLSLAFVLIHLHLDLLSSFCISLITICAQIFYSPCHGQTIGLTSASIMEIIIRMICAAALVVSVTFFASVMGPGYSGVLAAFPIASTVIAVFSHRNHSRFHAMDSLKALKFGLLSLLFFFLALALLTDKFNFNVAFILSILAALLIQLVLWLMRRQMQLR